MTGHGPPGPPGGRPPGGWSPLHHHHPPYHPRPMSPFGGGPTHSPPPRLVGSPSPAMMYGPRPGGGGGGQLPYIPCPRPRWPSPGPPPPPHGMASPLPFHHPHHHTPPPHMVHSPRPFRMPLHPPSPAPIRYGSPDFFRGVSPYIPTGPMDYGSPSRDYEYIGVPLEPPPITPQLPVNYQHAGDDGDDNDGPSTAEIIANQSQNYIDEKLAEYQMTIYQLQGKLVERVL